MKLSSIRPGVQENLMGAALADKLGGTYFAQPALQQPTAADPEAGFVRTAGTDSSPEIVPGPDGKPQQSRKQRRQKFLGAGKIPPGTN